MKILNAMQIKAGAKVDSKSTSVLSQPIQFLSRKEKDEEWAANAMDWYEWEGIKTLRENSRRLLKNYKLANGVIDKEDYIVEDNPEYTDIVEQLMDSDDSALELKFFPIIPNVINTLVNEFSKRNTKLHYRSVDDHSYNEMMAGKQAMIEERLLADAEMMMKQKFQDQGMDFGDPKVNEEMQNQMKTLPQIQQFYNTEYRSMHEQWAQHQYESDMEKFSIDELEEVAFRDMLITDREFWHLKMMDNDYKVELWNPLLTFYQKSPNQRYISEGSHVGKLELLTLPDVIDAHGWNMTEDQMLMLKDEQLRLGSAMAIAGKENDGSFYNHNLSHSENTEMPSLGYRQYAATNGVNSGSEDDVLNEVLRETEDIINFNFSDGLFRVATIYWKTQRKLGYLTKIDDFGEETYELIDEDYETTTQPLYNNTLYSEKNKDTLIFGEHIEWVYINEVVGGVKIGPNQGTYYGNTSDVGIKPIYLGINQNEIGRLKFQFKGDNNIFGSKLPVEGRVFSDRNTRSVTCVDLMKPWQIGYNIVNNQISDILVDELGTVIAFDQNGLPRHSMGEDWGKNNLAKAYTAMKDFSMIPFDTTITNTENPIAMQNLQVLNLEQTNRIMSRTQLANYFKQQAFENIGVSPQRMGQAIEQETAEGVRQAVNGSYAKTEQYFIQHSDQLMPRVHQMRTDLAQHYHSTNPSVRLQYLTSAHEKINFEINGTDLMLADINCYATTKSNHRATMERLRGLAMSNNTSGASIYDLGNVLKADSIPEIDAIMKASEQKVNKQRSEEQQHQQQMQQQQNEASQQAQQATRDYESMEAEKTRRNNVLIAEIKASGFGAMVDLDDNGQSDFKDSMDRIRQGDQYDSTMSFDREKESDKRTQHGDKMSIEREKIQAQRDMSKDKLNIARTNKNQYDTKDSGKTDKKKKK